MAKKSLTASFAHLLGIGRVVAEDQTDDEKKQGADESDEDYAKRMKKLEEDDQKKSAKAKADDDSQDDDDEKKQRPDESDEDYAKRMKKMEEEGDDAEADDTDEEMKGKGTAAAARSRERARCSAIFASSAAAARPDVAAHLAFNTTMSRKEAVGLLNSVAAGGASKGSALASRMTSIKLPIVGSDNASAPAAGSAASIAQQIIAAAAKARGDSK
ncbi:MAG: hypothetical protein HKM00_09510 [Gallionella sp.]|nr:hypothetical protein [Gallionella sp.]